MILAKEMVVRKLTAKSDSQLITGQLSGIYLANEPQLAKYLRYVCQHPISSGQVN